jgi:hypothetical protein
MFGQNRWNKDYLYNQTSLLSGSSKSICIFWSGSNAKETAVTRIGFWAFCLYGNQSKRGHKYPGQSVPQTGERAKLFDFQVKPRMAKA